MSRRRPSPLRQCPDCGKWLGRGAWKNGLAIHGCGYGENPVPVCTVCGVVWRSGVGGPYGPENDCTDGLPSHAWCGRTSVRKEDGRSKNTRARRSLKNGGEQ